MIDRENGVEHTATLKDFRCYNDIDENCCKDRSEDKNKTQHSIDTDELRQEAIHWHKRLESFMQEYKGEGIYFSPELKLHPDQILPILVWMEVFFNIRKEDLKK